MIELSESKFLALACLGLGSFILGVLPAALRLTRFLQWPLTMSALLCFGGGVLFATSVLHILPEVQGDMSQMAEAVFCLGFFLLYFVDELVHYWTSHEGRDFHSSSSHMANERTSLLQPAYRNQNASLLCHTSFSKPCSQAPSSRLGLTLALTLHAILEGLAIGLQGTVAQVLLLVVAVASHKLVVSFSLGMELAITGNRNLCAIASEMALFSFGSSLGIGLGMVALKSEQLLAQPAIPTLQGIAGGTLLYVTLCEVLPRERSKWHHQLTHRAAGLVQFFSVALGFSTVFLLTTFFKEKA